jgi:hypothetical protein
MTESSVTKEPRYTMAELQAAAVDLGVYPWDVAGIYKMVGADLMTEEEFKAALERWRTSPV